MRVFKIKHACKHSKVKRYDFTYNVNYQINIEILTRSKRQVTLTITHSIGTDSVKTYVINSIREMSQNHLIVRLCKTRLGWIVWNLIREHNTDISNTSLLTNRAHFSYP
jgi:hypothetical protein